MNLDISKPRVEMIKGANSTGINAYLPEDFTTKTLRTRHGTVAAFKAAQIEKLTIKSLCEAAGPHTYIRRSSL